VLGVYLALSWGVFQVVKELTQLFGLPDWVPGFGIVLLLIGLPIVLATAFVQDGSRKEPAAEPMDPTLMPMSGATSSPERHVDESTPRSPSNLILTWKRAVLGGVAAFLLLGITAGGYMGMRNAGVGPFGSLVASGELNAREPILIAEFEALNGDSTLARTVTEAFRVDFTQSPSVTVVQPKHVRQVLQRMSRDVNAHVDADLAHEIAIRDNIKTYLVGELSQAGGKYIVAGKLVATRDGRVLASYRETAANADEIIDAVDRLSKKLRNKIGESLKTIRAEKPLELVSTPSLEALQKYTQGAYAIDVERDYAAGISLLEEAIALDTAFAMAWRKLAVAYGNSDAGEDKRRRAAFKAYSFRDRLTDIERYNAMGMYLYGVKRDHQKALGAYEMLAERDPTWPPNNLGIAYQNLREYRKAIDAYKRSIAIDTTLMSSYLNLIDVYVILGHRDSANLALEDLRTRFGERPEINQKKFAIESGFRDYERAATALSLPPGAERNPMWRAGLSHAQADVAMVYGRMREAERYRAIGVAADVERGNAAYQVLAPIWQGFFAWYAQQDPQLAKQLVEQGLAKHPLEKFAPLDRPYESLALFYAMIGERARAEEYRRLRLEVLPEELRSDGRNFDDWYAGALAFGEKRYAEALPPWKRLSERGSCTICMDSEVALAFAMAGQPDSAIARLEHYVNTPDSDAVWEDAVELAVAYERLADMYAKRGDTQKALLYAGKFVTIWQNADASLQPRVQAKREMIRQLRSS
jgi:tetratricopeptide (TPR) repeat protein